MKFGFAGLLSFVVAFGLGEEQERPDILLIMLDDSGYTDFGCYRSEIDTLRIDALSLGKGSALPIAIRQHRTARHPGSGC